MLPFDEQDLQEVMTQVGPLWEDLRDARVLIVGGTGFIGRWMVETLLYTNEKMGLNAEVLVLSRNVDRDSFGCHRQSLLIGQGDIQAPFRVDNGKVTHIIHAAAPSSTPISDIETFDTIVQGTRNVLQCAFENEAKRVLYLSSGAATRGKGAYADAKRAAETLCHIYADMGLPVAIARPYALVGPGLPLDAHYAIGNFIRDAMAGGPIVVKGDGRAVRSYLYASDMAVWLWKTLLLMPLNPVDIGSHITFSIEALAGIVRDTLAPNADVLLRGERGLKSNRYVPSPLSAWTNQKQAVPLVEAIQRTARWHGWNG